MSDIRPRYKCMTCGELSVDAPYGVNGEVKASLMAHLTVNPTHEIAPVFVLVESTVDPEDPNASPDS